MAFENRLVINIREMPIQNAQSGALHPSGILVGEDVKQRRPDPCHVLRFQLRNFDS